MADIPIERQQDIRELHHQQAELAKERDELNMVLEILKIINDSAKSEGRTV
jgi:hypothetical protein